MRIAYVSADPGVPVFGHKGCSVHVQEIVRAWRARGDEVELFAASRGGLPPGDLIDLRVHDVARATDGDVAQREREALSGNAKLATQLRHAGDFDLIYERHALWSYAAMEFAQAALTPSVLEVNSPLVDEQSRHRRLADPTAARQAAKRAFTAAGTVVAVSRPVAEYVSRHLDDDRCVHVVENGVDVARFTPHLPQRPESDEFTIGFVGSMKPWHGVETLLAAFTRLLIIVPTARLLLVGDGPLRSEFETAVDRGGTALRNAVRFVGAVPPAEIPAWLHQMDLAVACPADMDDYYFSPLKVFEYMAAGVPVVASRVGQLAEVIDDGVNGVLCTPGDATSLAAQLMNLHANPALRRRLAQAGRRRAVQRHTWESVVERIVKFLPTSPVAVRHRQSLSGA